MACELCDRFPAPTVNFDEIAVSAPRHATLYRCRNCGVYIEHVAEERSVRFTPIKELKHFYPQVFGSD